MSDNVIIAEASAEFIVEDVDPVVVESVVNEVVVTSGDDVTIITGDTPIEVVTQGIQGPAGSSGSGSVGELAYYDVNVDVVSPELLYRGEAVPRTDISAPLWRISKVVIGYGTVTTTQTTYPQGSDSFAFSWSQRALYTYS